MADCAERLQVEQDRVPSQKQLQPENDFEGACRAQHDQNSNGTNGARSPHQRHDIENAAPRKTKNLHLIVVQHGWWGAPENVSYMEHAIEDAAHKHRIKTVVINPDVNKRLNSFEGVDVCGERLTNYIVQKSEELLRQGTPVTHLSMVGCSLGGMMVRYAAGKLYYNGYFGSTQARSPLSNDPNEHMVDPALDNQRGPWAHFRVRPVNLTTIATPHLGVHKQRTDLWPQIWPYFFNLMVPYVAARSGQQMMLQDEHAFRRPLFINMADPNLPFMKALALFPHLMCLANTRHDSYVPYHTAAICDDNPFKVRAGVSISPRYPSIVRPARPGEKPRRGLFRKLFAFADDDVPPSDPGEASPDQPRTGEESDEVRNGPPGCPARRQEKHTRTGEATDEVCNGPPGCPARRKENQTNDTSGSESQGPAGEGGDEAAAWQAAEGGGNPAKTFLGRNGLTIRILFFLFWPITIPFVIFYSCYALFLGTKAWWNVKGQRFDHSWLESYARNAALQRALHGMAPASPTELAIAAAAEHGLMPGTAVIANPNGNTMQNGVQQYDIQIVVNRGEEYMTPPLTASIPGHEHQAQLWMMQQLNKLKWIKVPVDTRHYQAHAAIYRKNPKRYKSNSNLIDYVVDHLVIDFD